MTELKTKIPVRTEWLFFLHESDSGKTKCNINHLMGIALSGNRKQSR